MDISNIPTPESDRFAASFADGMALPSHAEWLYKLQDMEKRMSSQRLLAAELISAIRINALRGTLVYSDYQLVDSFLQQFVNRLAPFEAPPAREG
jgi:hypothetical protein